MAANMWKNSLKNVESDKNKILYETSFDFFYSETVLTFRISLVILREFLNLLRKRKYFSKCRHFTKCQNSLSYNFPNYSSRYSRLFRLISWFRFNFVLHWTVLNTTDFKYPEQLRVLHFHHTCNFWHFKCTRPHTKLTKLISVYLHIKFRVFTYMSWLVLTKKT